MGGARPGIGVPGSTGRSPEGGWSLDNGARAGCARARGRLSARSDRRRRRGGHAALRLARSGRRTDRKGGAAPIEGDPATADALRCAAAVGPGIGACCYEVGPEVVDAFARYENAADGRMLDLRAVADAQLRAAGIERIEHVDYCTSCHPELFFSHRRDEGVTGRQGGIAWLTG